MRVLGQLRGVLGAAMILLAFSEFVFVNEGPVRTLTEAGGIGDLLGDLGLLVAFYVAPALLLLALDPFVTTWLRALFAGAFVGWSIEAALVPAAYEAVPFSYAWTSVSWHAVVTVGLGYLALRAARRARPAVLAAVAVVAGAAWGVWATWPWGQLRLDLAEFATLAAVVAGLLTAGYWLVDGAVPPAERGRGLLWIAVGINGALWLLNAVVFPLQALGLAVVAGVTGLALVRAPRGNGASLAAARAPRPLGFALPAAGAAVAVATYALLLRTGQPVPAEDLIWPPAFAGIGLFLAGLVLAFLPRRHPRPGEVRLGADGTQDDADDRHHE